MRELPPFLCKKPILDRLGTMRGRIVHVKKSSCRLPSDMQAAQQQGLAYSLQHWEEVGSFDSLILKTFQVNKTSSVNEGNNQKFFAAPGTPRLLRMIIGRRKPLFVLLLCPGLNDVEPCLVCGHDRVQEVSLEP